MAHSAHPVGGNSKRSEIQELRESLQNPELQRDKVKYCRYVQQVMAYMTLGIDVSSLFSEMIKASVTNDLVQKKLVYLYLRVQAKSNEEVAILMISTLTKDAADDNPMIRGLALRTMCELKIQSLLDYLKEPILQGLSDKSSYVRKIAVIGALKVFRFAPDVMKALNIVKRLLGMLNDFDKQVVANTVFALTEICSCEDDIAVLKGIVETVLARLHSFDEWTQSVLLSALARHQPANQQDLVTILNNFDEKLKHSNKGVVIASAKLFLVYTQSIDALKADVLDRLVGPLLSVVMSSIPELSYTGLAFLSTVYRGRTHFLAERQKAFYLRGNELPYLKKCRMTVLTEIVNESNLEEILSEIRCRVTDTDICVAKYATKCIGKIGARHKAAAARCIDLLLTFLELDLDHIAASIFESIKDILNKMDHFGNTFVANVDHYWEKASDSSAKAALLWILGEFGHSIPNSPYIMEDLVDSLEQEQSSTVRLEFLNAALRLFLKRPPEFQNVVGRILHYLIEEEINMDVHDRALFYYRSLRKDVLEVHKLLDAARDLKMSQVMSSQACNTQEVMLENLNTLSSLANEQAWALR